MYLSKRRRNKMLADYERGLEMVKQARCFQKAIKRLDKEYLALGICNLAAHKYGNCITSNARIYNEFHTKMSKFRARVRRKGDIRMLGSSGCWLGLRPQQGASLEQVRKSLELRIQFLNEYETL